MDKNIETERENIKNDIVKEGEEVRKSLLDKLFTLNTILSAAFLVLYQFDKNSFQIKILNLLPFCSVLLILLYQLINLRALGFAYHKIDKWEKGDLDKIKSYHYNGYTVIVTSMIMTVVELIYLFTILLDV